LVSTDPDRLPQPGPGYIYVDWGPGFYAKHNASFPDFLGPALTANIGWLGLHHILQNGGSGYFHCVSSERISRIAGSSAFLARRNPPSRHTWFIRPTAIRIFSKARLTAYGA
jgi:LysR family transcriptional regulator, flagellar master operon regulator